MKRRIWKASLAATAAACVAVLLTSWNLLTGCPHCDTCIDNYQFKPCELMGSVLREEGCAWGENGEPTPEDPTLLQRGPRMTADPYPAPTPEGRPIFGDCSWQVELCWTPDGSAGGDNKLCFYRDAGYDPNGNSPHNPNDPTYGRKGRYDPNRGTDIGYKVYLNYYPDDANRFTLYGCNGYQITQNGEGQGSIIKLLKSGELLMTWQWGQDGNVFLVSQGPTSFTVTDSNGCRITTATLHDGEPSETVVEKRYVFEGTARKRMTVVTDGGTRFQTTIVQYHSSGNGTGKPWFILRPQDVERFLSEQSKTGVDPNAPENSCDLDTASSDSLKAYALTRYESYDQDQRLKEVRGSGCGGCSGGGEGTYYFAYRTDSNSFNDPNRWKTAVRTLTPSGLRRVEFVDVSGRTIFDVTQAMGTDGNVARRWVHHYLYDFYGRVVEHRYPSACTDYQFAETQEQDPNYLTGTWTTGVTVPGTGNSQGLVRIYEYADTGTAYLLRSCGKVRNGRSGTAHYVSATEYDPNIALPIKTYAFPDANDAWNVGLATSYTYTFYDANRTQIKFKTVDYPKVPGSQNGQGDGAGDPNCSVTYHYLRVMDGEVLINLYNDWTRHQDGSLSFTDANNTDQQVLKTVQDVNTNQLTLPDLPGNWANPDGTHLETLYAYDNYGRLSAQTAPGAAGQRKKTVYYYASVYDSSKNRGRTLYQATLVSPHMDSDGNYAYLPIQISVTDLNGRTVVSAEGMTGSPADGSLANDWNETGTVNDSFTAFLRDANCKLFSRTVSTYDPNTGHLVSTTQWTAAADANAAKLVTTYSYDPNAGWQQMSASPNGVIRFSRYDQLGRVIEEWVGTDANGATNDNPGGGGSNLQKISAVFYDEATPGSGTSGVGDGHVTSRRSCFGTGAADYRKVVNKYDYRGRLDQTRNPDKVAVKNTYDNADRLLYAETYADNNENWTTDSGELRAKTESKYDKRGQVYQSIVYEVTGGTVVGSMTTNYWYDLKGRTAKVLPPGTGVAYTKATYNGTDQVTGEYLCSAEGADTSAWSLTNDTILLAVEYAYNAGGQQTQRKEGAAVGSTTAVEKTWYDTSRDGQGAWRPYVTGISRLKASDSTSDFALTQYAYDAAGRLAAVIDPDPDGGGSLPAIRTEWTYDDLDRETSVKVYTGASGGTLVAQSADTYEGTHLKQSKVYRIVSGSAGDTMTTTYYYDHLGRTCKVLQPSGVFTKTAYNLAGQVTGTYICHAEGGTEDPNGLVGDVVAEQTLTTYDPNTGLPWLTRRFQRKHTDTTSTGELTTSNARVTYSAAWYDDLGRTIKTIDYGTNGGSAITSKDSDFDPATSGTQNYDNAPDANTSDLYVVAKVAYDGYGRAWKTTDNAGRVTKSIFDDAGRKTHVIENYVAWQNENPDSPPARSVDENRITRFQYNAAGQVTYLTAVDPNADGDTADNQATRYVYADELSEKGCPIARNNLLRAVIYPDTDDTVSGSALSNGGDGNYDRVEYTYYADGTRKTLKDQRGTLHTYEYDDLTRLTADRVDELGAGVDGTIRRIARSYEDQGRLLKVTSYDANSAGTIRNQVKSEYTWSDVNQSWGNVTQAQQAHAGEVESNTPSVKYDYTEVPGGAGPIKAYCLRKVTFPNAQYYYYNYVPESGGVYLGRLGSISDTNTDANAGYAVYKYMGDRTIYKVQHTQVTGGLNLTYDPNDNASYGGWDRLGRVAQQRWQNDSGTVKDRFNSGYDVFSNRKWRENPVTSGKSELYTYDRLNRLTKAERGDLNGNKDTISSTNFRQDWLLSAVGNWDRFCTDSDGSDPWDSNQTRGHNKVNEITAIGDSNAHLAYDLAGNMTKVPRPGAEDANHFTCTYDAWNRLVKVQNDDASATVAEYRYDGLNRRVAKLLPNGQNWKRTDFFYNEAWQVVEERYNDSQADSNAAATATKAKYVWDIRYIDAPVVRWWDQSGDGDFDEPNEVLYYCGDFNVNVTALVDPDGNVVERYQYDPYGKVTVLDGSWNVRSSGSAYANEILYCGYRYDPETGFYDVRYRKYLSLMGRWGQVDLLRYPDGMNYYEYVGARPVASADPFGQVSVSSQPASSPNAECICGPDVTKWFVQDLILHEMVAAGIAKDAGNVRLHAFRFQARYWMAYKWMNFDVEGCGTGPCAHTVMIWGVCLRKNQLGNIAFGLVGTLFPPRNAFGKLNTPMEVMELAYNINDGRYPKQHPHAADYGKYAGTLRKDNLMGFRVGSFVAAQMRVKRSIRPEAWESLMPGVLGLEPTQEDYKRDFLKLYYDKGGKDKITAADLTWIPEYRGFNTRSCKKCPNQWKPSGTSFDAFHDLLDSYAKPRFADWGTNMPPWGKLTRDEKLELFVRQENLFTGFDGWLQREHEGYDPTNRKQ